MDRKTVVSNGIEWESINISIPEEYMKQFDFIDLGAKEGKMGKYANENFSKSGFDFISPSRQSTFS